jgi:hypothetical protein
MRQIKSTRTKNKTKYIFPARAKNKKEIREVVKIRKEKSLRLITFLTIRKPSSRKKNMSKRTI